jgi:cytochrome c-type protein NapB
MNQQQMLIAAVGMLWCVTTVASEQGALRGGAAIDETNAAHELKYLQKDKGVLDRAYVQQPPLIPHKIDGYQVDRNFNKCLSCHSWSKAREAGATKVSLTHFRDRDGKELSDVSPRRYFCTQCHVPQTDAPQLVENTFKPVKSLSNK